MTDAGRLAAVAAMVSQTSVADVDAARRLARSATLTAEERVAILRLALFAERALSPERGEDDGA